MSDVDDYLAALPKASRETLEKLRSAIRAAAPEATERISYQMPVFVHHGLLVSYAAFKDHCSFFPMSSKLIAAHKVELEPYSTAKGTIRFPIGKPLPSGLVKKLVKERVKENESKAASKTVKRRPAKQKSGHN